MISRSWFLVGFLVCATLLGTAYFYFEQSMGLHPCPFCMMQRVCVGVVGIACLLGFIFKPGRAGGKFIAFITSLASLAGVAIAGRQVWLQHLPADQVPECGSADLSFMLENWPFMEVIQTVMRGSGECAEVQWQFLSLSMPEWMVGVFTVMLILSLRFLFAKKQRYFRSDYRAR